jgi:sterol desaturase/sphingolipid hydroxylase (fatty acid hydroxylase superfamily)
VPAWLDAAFDALLGVLGLLADASVSVYWGHLATALVIAAIVSRARSPAAIVRATLPRAIWTHRSVRHDLGLFFINTLLHSFVFFAPLQLVSAHVSFAVWSTLGDVLGANPAPLTGVAASLGLTVCTFVAADFAFWISHWAQHRIAPLWEFHKVHHSAPVLAPFTVFRRHPIDILVQGFCAGMIVGAAYGAWSWACGGAVDGLTILGANAILFVCLAIGFNLQHSHVWLSFGPLDRVLISPAAHQIHHSLAPEHRDRNFGNMLSIWDRLFGTHVRPQSEPQALRLGVEDPEHYGGLLQLYVVPIVRAFSLAVKRFRG